MLPTSHYDEEKAERAVKFIEMLCHTKGEFAGKPFLLLPWQMRLVKDLFGVVKEDGTRQFKTAFVEIPKKNWLQFTFTEMCPKRNPSNCWNTLKPMMPQRRDETSPDVMAAKAERNHGMAHGQILNAERMGDQQPSPEQGEVQRLSFGVGPSGSKWWASVRMKI